MRIKAGAKAAILLLLIAGCGKKEPAGAGLETREYQEWKGSQSIRQMISGGAADALDGTVTVYFPQDRSKNPEDFVELLLNGFILQRTRIRPPTAPFSLKITLRPGPDWFDLWDSTTNRNYRFQIDTRQGTDFVLSPSASGYDISWTKRE